MLFVTRYPVSVPPGGVTALQFTVTDEPNDVTLKMFGAANVAVVAWPVPVVTIVQNAWAAAAIPRTRKREAPPPRTQRTSFRRAARRRVTRTSPPAR
jgi:hypothetical protein